MRPAPASVLAINGAIKEKIMSNPQREPFHIPVWLGLCLFLAIAAFFLWEEHRAHILGVLPYGLLLLCPVIHLFMHRGHGSHGAGHSGPEGHAHHEAGRGDAP